MVSEWYVVRQVICNNLPVLYAITYVSCTVSQKSLRVCAKLQIYHISHVLDSTTNGTIPSQYQQVPESTVNGSDIIRQKFDYCYRRCCGIVSCRRWSGEATYVCGGVWSRSTVTARGDGDSGLRRSAVSDYDRYYLPVDRSQLAISVSLLRLCNIVVLKQWPGVRRTTVPGFLESRAVDIWKFDRGLLQLKARL